jgi:hypothetical protein
MAFNMLTTQYVESSQTGLLRQRNRQRFWIQKGNPVLALWIITGGQWKIMLDGALWFATNAYASMGIGMPRLLKKGGLPEADRLEF